MTGVTTTPSNGVGMTPLSSNTDVRLPGAYVNAKRALTECSRLDECQDWADQAAALASYAKQANDDTLHKMAVRIQARAIRRCGELLKQHEPKSGARTDLGPVPTRGLAAKEAGLSERQAKTAVRVTSVPGEDFESAVESDTPPTVTALAEQGKKPRTVELIDLGGRDPEEFALSTDGQGRVRQLAEFCGRVDAGVVARGAMPNEWQVIRRDIETIDSWLRQLIAELEG